MRRKIVAGNWKMNLLKEEAQSLTSEVANMAKDELDSSVELIVCPPSIHLQNVVSLAKEADKVAVGAQNCYSEKSGAFTGELSAGMLADYGVKYVILGHSERREYFMELNQQLAKKVELALEEGLSPIFCVGERLAEREAEKQEEVVGKQLEEGLFHLEAEDFEKVIIAYEPVWAIGTGKTATAEQAQDMHQRIRKMIAGNYGEEIAGNTPILYGGSCKPSNAKELFACQDVDGGLIGGASLKSRDFVSIAKSF